MTKRRDPFAGVFESIKREDRARSARERAFVKRLQRALKSMDGIHGARPDPRVKSGTRLLVLPSGDGHAYCISIYETNVVRRDSGEWRWYTDE